MKDGRSGREKDVAVPKVEFNCRDSALRMNTVSGHDSEAFSPNATNQRGITQVAQAPYFPEWLALLQLGILVSFAPRSCRLAVVPPLVAGRFQRWRIHP
jgi:hypothetical protein